MKPEQTSPLTAEPFTVGTFAVGGSHISWRLLGKQPALGQKEKPSQEWFCVH